MRGSTACGLPSWPSAQAAASRTFLEFIRQRYDKWEHRAGVAELAEGFGGDPSNVAVFGV